LIWELILAAGVGAIVSALIIGGIIVWWASKIRL
jgi:hypothetical protein